MLHECYASPALLYRKHFTSHHQGGEQGWRSGESTRFPPLWAGFVSRTRRHMWIEFVVGSRPCSEGFSPGSPVFFPPQKSTLLNSNSIWKQWMKSHLVEMPLQIPLFLLLSSSSSSSRERPQGLLLKGQPHVVYKTVS